MSDRYMNDMACGIEPEREGDEPTLEQWRARCRELWTDNIGLRHALDMCVDRGSYDMVRDGLRTLCRAYVNLLEVGRDRIVSLGGECDSVEKMETGDPALIAAKALLQPLT